MISYAPLSDSGQNFREACYCFLLLCLRTFLCGNLVGFILVSSLSFFTVMESGTIENNNEDSM